MYPLDQRKPLEFFFPRLVAMYAVKIALRKALGKRASAIITKLKKRQPLSDDELEVRNTISDLVQNGSKGVAAICWEPGSSSEDWGCVNIMQYGSSRYRSVYWIDDEFGEAKFFGSLKVAKDYAVLMCNPLPREGTC
jgi:hypothetical protein